MTDRELNLLRELLENARTGRGRVLQRPLALHARLSALDGRRVRRQYLPAEHSRTAR